MVDLTVLSVNNILNAVQILTLIALIVYVIKTWQMASATREYAAISEKTLQEMRDSRDQESAPYIVTYFDIPFGQQFIFFVIKNIGKTSAERVKIDINPPLVNSKGINFNNFPFLNDKISIMPPGYEIKTMFDFFPQYVENEDSPMTFDVNVTYYGGLNKEPRLANYQLDLSVHDGLLYVNKKSLDDLITEIETINTNLNEIKGKIR